MAKLAYDIILKPVITEKSMEMLTQGKYTFKVAKDSNKIEIAKAVEALFPGVKVAKVNTVNCPLPMGRLGSFRPTRPRRMARATAFTASS